MAALSPFIHKNRGLITLRFLARTCARYFHASGRNRNPAAEHSTQANDRPGKNHRSLSDCGRLRSLAAEKKFQDTRAICLPRSLGGMLCLFVGNPTDRNSYAGVSPLACFQVADISRAGSFPRLRGSEPRGTSSVAGLDAGHHSSTKRRPQRSRKIAEKREGLYSCT